MEHIDNIFTTNMPSCRYEVGDRFFKLETVVTLPVLNPEDQSLNVAPVINQKQYEIFRQATDDNRDFFAAQLNHNNQLIIGSLATFSMNNIDDIQVYKETTIHGLRYRIITHANAADDGKLDKLRDDIRQVALKKTKDLILAQAMLLSDLSYALYSNEHTDGKPLPKDTGTTYIFVDERKP